METAAFNQKSTSPRGRGRAARGSGGVTAARTYPAAMDSIRLLTLWRRLRGSAAGRWLLNISTMAVGNIQGWDHVNTIVGSGRADLCALARPSKTQIEFPRARAALENSK